VIGFKPDELGLDISPRTLREEMQEALKAEGVPTGQWQRLPVPEQGIFQARVGYGKGCPWKCSGSMVEYNKGDYPEASAFIDSHCYVFNVNPPNDLQLMGLYVEAFQKVMDNLDQVL
jgi:hypothetical protein